MIEVNGVQKQPATYLPYESIFIDPYEVSKKDARVKPNGK